MLRLLATLSVLAFAAALAQAVHGIGIWKTVPIEAGKITPDGGLAFRAKLPGSFDRPLDDARGFITENGERTGRRAGSNDTVRKHGRGWFKILRGNIRFSSTDTTDPLTNGRAYAAVVPRPVPLTLLYGLLALSIATAALAFRQNPARPGTGDAEEGRYWIPKPKTAFRIPPFWIFLLASALAAYLVFFPGGEFTDQGLVVKGMPYSDAEGWNEMAVALAEGRGFTGEFYTHRPFYSVFLGGLYRIFGPHYLVAKIVNILAAGLLAASAYLLVSRAFKSVAAGVAIALFLVLAPGHFKLVQITATEQLGLAFTVFSLYLTWAAFTTRRSSLFFAAGIFLGLSNLTRTFTLLAFPVYGVILFLLYAITRPGFFKFFHHALLFGGGVILVFAPWVARQKYSHDIYSISSNSADLLYGAAAYGRWDQRQYKEAAEAGIEDSNPARHPFFNRRLSEVVKADPERYEMFVKARLVENLGTSFNPSAPAFRLAAGLVALFAALRLCWLRRSAAGLVALALFLPAADYLTRPDVLTFSLPVADTASDEVPVPLIDPDKPTSGAGIVLLLAAIPLACFPFRKGRLVAVALLAATLAGSAALSALVGNFGFTRTATFGGWIYVALAIGGITGLFQLVGGILQKFRPVESAKGEPEPPPGLPHVGGKPENETGTDPGEPGGEGEGDGDFVLPNHPPDAFAITTAYLTIFVSLLGITLMGLALLGRLADKGPVTWELPNKSTNAAIQWAKREFAAEIAADPGAPPTVVPVLLGDYRADLKAGEDVAHWSDIFEVRDGSRTVAKVRAGTDPILGGGNLLAVHFAGRLPPDLPRRQPFALVGLKTDNVNQNRFVPGHEPVEIDALALIPLDSERAPEFDKAVRFTPAGDGGES